MRPIAAAFAAVFFTLGLLGAWLLANVTLTWVENSEQAELDQVFYAGGITWAKGKADGFVVTLKGDAETKADQARAVRIARLVFGDTLRDETLFNPVVAVRPRPEPPHIELLKNGHDLTVLGRMPQGETTRIFAKYMASLGPDANISNVTDPIENAPENWLPAFEFSLRLAPLTAQSIINVSPGAVRLEAVAMSDNQLQGFREMAARLRPEGVALQIDVSPARPIIAPYTFVYDIGAPAVAKCAAPDPLEAAGLEATVARLMGGDIHCAVGLGAPSARWSTAVKAGLKALASMGAGRLDISDADVSVSAPSAVAPQDFKRAVQTLRLALPEGFLLHVTAPERPARRAVPDSQPMEFTATLDAAGHAIVEGAVKDTLTREVVMRFSEAKFGYGQVEDRMWMEARLPDGWQARVFKLIEALSLLNEGSATMTVDGLDIGGAAGFAHPAAELAKVLDGVYDPGKTTLAIRYIKPVSAAPAQGLDPRLCVSRVSKILADAPIVFASSSAVISASSLPTIAKMAAVLTQCRSARIEIGGHTDNQGGTAMNLTLSQRRADAVLDALLGQNLLLGALSAKGYGESEPLVDNSTDAGRATNRRIEAKILRDMPDTAAAPDTGAPAGAGGGQSGPISAGQVPPDKFTRPAMRARP